MARKNQVSCTNEECRKSYAPRLWGTVRAMRAGWFIHPNGDARCPAHIPTWVKLLREIGEKEKERS